MPFVLGAIVVGIRIFSKTKNESGKSFRVGVAFDQEPVGIPDIVARIDIDFDVVAAIGSNGECSFRNCKCIAVEEADIRGLKGTGSIVGDGDGRGVRNPRNRYREIDDRRGDGNLSRSVKTAKTNR